MKNYYNPANFQNHPFVPQGASSDSEYLLRKMLQKGICEAEYRSYSCPPEQINTFRNIKLQLESSLDKIDATGFALLKSTPHGRQMLMSNLTTCKRLSMLSLVEESYDFNQIVIDIAGNLNSPTRRNPPNHG